MNILTICLVRGDMTEYYYCSEGCYLRTKDINAESNLWMVDKKSGTYVCPYCYLGEQGVDFSFIKKQIDDRFYKISVFFRDNKLVLRSSNVVQKVNGDHKNTDHEFDVDELEGFVHNLSEMLKYMKGRKDEQKTK
jgi:hypothetical protein